jgi:hypothetical protein
MEHEGVRVSLDVSGISEYREDVRAVACLFLRSTTVYLHPREFTLNTPRHTMHHADVMVVTVVTMNRSCLTFKSRAHARRFDHHRVVLNVTRTVITVCCGRVY